MKISVVVPVYNVNPLLFDACLKSARDRFGDSDAEIIVCDDGSKTELSVEYRETCRRYTARYRKLFRNLGMAIARNFGGLMACGDYLFFLDSDDVVAQFDVDLLYSAFEGAPSMIVADHQQVDFSGTTVLATRIKERYFSQLEKYAGGIFDPLLFSTFIFHPLIFSRIAFLELGGFNIEYSSGDEIDLQLRLCEKCGFSRVSYMRAIVYQYRKNPASVVHNPGLYAELIRNIEAIIAFHCSRRAGESVSAQRYGRSLVTGAAHYKIHRLSNYSEIIPPWLSDEFDLIASA